METMVRKISTLADILPELPQLQSWWRKFAELNSELARQLEMNPARLEHGRLHFGEYETRGLHQLELTGNSDQFATVVATMAWPRSTRARRHTAELVNRSVSTGRPDLARLAAAYALADERWGVESIERRLGMTLERAYWAMGVFPAPTDEPEPYGFLLSLVEGAASDSPSAVELARILFVDEMAW